METNMEKGWYNGLQELGLLGLAPVMVHAQWANLQNYKTNTPV